MHGTYNVKYCIRLQNRLKYRTAENLEILHNSEVDLRFN
jgi:hypothetical protein